MNRRWLYAVAVVVIVLLTGLLRNGLQPRTARLDGMERALENFENAQHVLRRDVISVRAGLMQSFDPLVSDVRALHRSLDPLSQAGDTEVVAPLVARLRASAVRQEALTETLKSDSALLQNSLAYFGALSAKADPVESPDPEAGRLSGAMLRLTLDTSPETRQIVDRRIAAFARQPARGPADREARAVLLSHARLLRRLLPEADAQLASLLADDDRAARAELRLWIGRERAAAERTAQAYRYALYATAVVLTVAIANLAFRLAAHLTALRRRSAFHHALAQMSARIVAAHPHEVTARLDEGLSRLAGHAGSDAAFLFGEGGYACARLWPPCPRTHAADWCPAARNLAEAIGERPDGVFHGRLDWPAPTGNNEARRPDILAVRLVNEHGDRCVLGFARFEGRVEVPAADLDVIRLALDVLAGAVRRSRAEQHRAVLETRLRHAGRLEAVGAFASGIAHNFNNILGAIGGYAEMAAERAGPRSVAGRHAGQIGLAVVRARRLVDQIRDYGRRPVEPPAPIDLRDLLDESVSLLRAAHGRTATFDVGEAPSGLDVLGDPERLQQVILNLGANAVQAAGGGMVRLGLTRRSNPAPTVMASGVLLAGDYVVLSVADEGPGISAVTQARIFDPFFTTRAEGTGLGLATTAQTARELGGAVGVRSSPGQGALFEVWLPALGRVSTRLQPPSGLGQAILLLDADQERLSAGEEAIAALGFEPIGFTAGEAALSALAAWPQRFDALVVRTSPGDLVSALRRAAPRVGIIVVADGADPTALRAVAASAGHCHIAAWPLEPDILMLAVGAGDLASV